MAAKTLFLCRHMRQLPEIIRVLAGAVLALPVVDAESPRHVGHLEVPGGHPALVVDIPRPQVLSQQAHVLEQAQEAADQAGVVQPQSGLQTAS